MLRGGGSRGEGANSCPAVGFPAPSAATVPLVHLELAALVVDDYDRAIEFFVHVLGFDLVEDSPSRTNDGRPKRWVVVRPPGGQTALLLAQADGPEQAPVVGRQFAGRVGFFLRVPAFEDQYRRMLAAGVVERLRARKPA